MKFKLFFSICVIVLAILIYFGYPTIKDRFFSNKSKIDVVNLINEQKNDQSGEAVNVQTSTNAVEIKSSSLEITITPSDCDNECSEFKKDNELEYCKEVCGLASTVEENTEKNVSNNCGSINGLQKDYCLKELAVKNKDFKTCEVIVDSGVKKACKNRITEDIIESQ